MRPPRLAIALLAVVALSLSSGVANAASRPGQVGLITFTKATLSSTGATLTVDWPSVSGATSYKVFASTSYDGVKTQTIPLAQPKGSAATLSNLRPGVDYFVQVSAVSAAGVTGDRSQRVGHGTIKAEAAPTAGSPNYLMMSWNICSYACPSISSRAKIIKSRIKELKPGIVALQEASALNVPPTGYHFAYNGQNDILVRTGVFSRITKRGTALTAGSGTFASKYSTKGRGVSWAALKHSESGKYIVVFNTHLATGTSKAQTAQREYEAGRLLPYVRTILARLDAKYGSLTDWTKAPVAILGDFNTNKSRAGDDTLAVLEKAGWYDAFDQSRALSGQHYNTANPEWKSAAVIGWKWGDHVDKVLVRPSRSVVYGWSNAGERSGSRFTTPLGSDHHPILVRAYIQ